MVAKTGRSLCAFMFLVSVVLTPSVRVSAQDWRDIAVDVDGDGLSNATEESGWYNATGGPYVTDYINADSDADGLTDGEEQLFSTNPLTNTMPGIYALYDADVLTKQYYSWAQYGARYISYGDFDGNPKMPTVVARRGTSFELGGSAYGQVSVDILAGSAPKDTSKIGVSGPDPCTGRWLVSIAPDAQVGMYDVTLQVPPPHDGGWEWRTLHLYVIFELPDDMTQAEIDTFVYDDDPDDLRDEVALWIDTDEVTDGSGGYWAYSYALRFDTMHYQEWLFEGYVIDEIDGLDNRWEAATALRAAADADTQFGHPRPLFNSLDVLYPGSDKRNQCSNIAGLLTAYARAAGIPSRPIMTDWRYSTFDHATEFWLHGASGIEPGDWYVNRGYSPRGGSPYYPMARSDWNYYPWYMSSGGSSDMVVVGGAGWPWEETSGEGEDETYDYEYHAVDPPPHEIVRQDWWETVTTYYWATKIISTWGWGDPPTEPVVTGMLPQDIGTQVYTPPADSQVPSPIQLDQIVNDYGLDQDGDGHFDQLVVEASVEVTEEDTYWLYALLGSDQQDGNVVGTGGAVASAAVPVDLEPGTHTVQIPFSGRDLFDRRADGPYNLINLWITDFETRDSGEIMSQAFDSLDAHDISYTTAPYLYSDFETPPAELAGDYGHHILEESGAGQVDVIVDVGLDIYVEGSYTVSGELYDGDNQLVAWATWTGSAGPASLRFEGLKSTDESYTLKYLELFDGEDNLLDSEYLAYTVEMPSTAHIVLPQSPASSGQMTSLDVTYVNVYSDTLVDLDGDGLFDRLDIDVQVAVDVSGSYRLEGWLVDQYDNLIALSLGDPVTLTTTGVQTLTLPFDGRMLHGYGADGPYTLVALKVLDGATYTVLDEVKVAHTTAAYDRDGFEPFTAARILFADYMEDGSSKWSYQSPWEVITATYHSPLHAWTDSPTSYYTDSVDAFLAITDVLDLSGLSRPALRFQTCRTLGAGDYGYVEVRDSTVPSWTAVLTYTGVSPYWEASIVDLSGFEDEDALQVRFRLQADDDGNTGDGWYIDDVFLIGWPTITDASFGYSPHPVLVGQSTTFEASYTSVDMTLPVTYTWDFGDATPAVVTGAQTVTHVFGTAIDYTVRLTVENPYGGYVFVQTIGVYVPVEGTSFTYVPSLPETSGVVTLTASYTPITATNDLTDPVVYEWNLGDGTVVTTTNQSITHSYSTGASYPVTLTTSNGYGTAVDDQIVEVKEGVSSVTLDMSGPQVEDEPLTFQAYITRATASQPVTYTWGFGGTSSPVVTTTSVIQHVYADPGTYTVWITADNGYGLPATYDTPLVIAGRPVTSASFTLTQTRSHRERETTFYATYAPVSATLPATYAWDFGDGSPVWITANATITREFPSSGTWTVWLTVTNGWGVPSTYSKVVTLPFDDDGDGLSNVSEWNIGTDPHDADTDGDTVSDYVEVYAGSSPPADTDGDGVINALDADDDDDGLPTMYEDPNGNGDPTDDDSNRDGIPDYLDPKRFLIYLPLSLKSK